MMMEISGTLVLNSVLTWHIAQEDFSIFIQCEIFKSYIILPHFSVFWLCSLGKASIYFTGNSKYKIGEHFERFIFLAYFPYFDKIKRRLMRQPCCLCIHLCIPLNFFVFYAVHVISKERRWLILPRTSCVYYEITLLSPPPPLFNVFYAVQVTPQESMRLVLPRTSCLMDAHMHTHTLFINLKSDNGAYKSLCTLKHNYI
jgi:hypothetical protein